LPAASSQQPQRQIAQNPFSNTNGAPANNPNNANSNLNFFEKDLLFGTDSRSSAAPQKALVAPSSNKKAAPELGLKAPPGPSRTRKQSLESAEKIDMEMVNKKVEELTMATDKSAPERLRMSIVWQGKLFYYVGQKPIRSHDWKAGWFTLTDHKFVGVSLEDSAKQVFNWSVCVGCTVERSEDISKRGDRSKWGYVFCLECAQNKGEAYFVAETDEKGAKWIQKLFDARSFTYWLAPWERADLSKDLKKKPQTVEEFSLLNS